MSDDPIERYLADMGEIWRTRSNVPETSFYPALERLLSDIGRTLAPKVRCVINPANRGAGIPDGGLFSAEQFRDRTQGADASPNSFPAPIPARGVVEAKGVAEDIRQEVKTDQIERYWKQYGTVLLTNFRSFALVGSGSDGRPSILESFSLADSETDFWALTTHPRKVATERGERMLGYLKRVLRHNAPLTAPQDVAAILASYAHDARLRIESAELPALAILRQSLEDALGLHFEGEKGEHFFRSTLIQTLFYGVFSAWVLWARRRDAKPSETTGFSDALRDSAAPYAVSGEFNWRSAYWLLRVPMLRGLFVQVADPARLGALGLIEVLDWTAAALNRVDRSAFFNSFDEGHAVQYFYEPFLHAFDPALRKELGVWYTPEEIVRYQVERVDSVLRSELGLADGLADPQVIVLDPCCGTGAYLRAVLRRIAATLHDKGGDGLIAQDLKTAAMERVFGFEILPAPFVIAHLQLGLELETLGAPLSDIGDPPERVGVYLTNALTGWEPPKGKPKQIAFPGFEDERNAAGKVKQEKPILVILGNPPYNAFAGVSPEEEEGLVEAYKGVYFIERHRKRKGKDQQLELPAERHYRLSDPIAKGGWGIRKFNLDDLYIRFFRLAEKRIAEHGGRGVVSFISNYSWTSEPSFVVLREHLLDSFDRFWIENMHGNRKISEYAPDGRTSETVFAIPGFSVGIQQGVAISLWVKHRERKGDPIVRYRDDLDDAKAGERRAHLLRNLDVTDFDGQYRTSVPRKDNRWSFRPSDVTGAYLGWPRLIDLCASPPSNGLMEKRGGALMDDDRAALECRMKRYFDKNVTFEELKNQGHPLTQDAARYDARKAREKLLAMEAYEADRVRRYVLRPFDSKCCYFTPVRPIWNEPRPSLWAQCWGGNAFVLTRFNGTRDPEGVPFYFARGLSDDHLLAPDAAAIALRLKAGSIRSVSRHVARHPAFPGMETEAERIVANLSAAARSYLASLGLPDPDSDQATAESIWYHALAIGYSPSYLADNADGIRQDWPRIPLPKAEGALFSSLALGRQVAALLETETAVAGVTGGKIRDELKTIAIFQRVDGNRVNLEGGDLDVTAGWGHAGKGGVTMPGKGKTLRRSDGGYDVFLNDVTCWQNVPEAVWTYTIGGYQVIKKWLSYREKPLLGRGLIPDEVRYVMKMARRLAALVALQPELDANYRAVVSDAVSWDALKQDAQRQ